jgi:hypothetical protein
MNNREVIKIIEDISDILLELNDQFDTSLIGEYSRSGMHDRFKEFDLELNYNNILDYFQSIPPNINRPTIKFEIKTKNSTNNFWIQPFYKIDGIISNRIIEERRHKVFQSTIEFMKKYNSIFNRIRSLLGGEYEIAYILPILKIGVGDGNKDLPLFKGINCMSNTISAEDADRFLGSDRTTIYSFEENKDDIIKNKNIYPYYMSCIFSIKKLGTSTPLEDTISKGLIKKHMASKKTLKDRIKRFIDFKK